MTTVRRKIFILLTVYVGLFLIGVTLVKTPLIGLRYNVSDSLPQRLFVSRSFQKPTRGAYVSFQAAHSTIPLVKEIVGLPGDEITYQNDHIIVQGKDCGSLLSQTSNGESLTPTLPGLIPAEHIYAYAPNPKSFDSRYKEFGLIPFSQLKETLWPVF